MKLVSVIQFYLPYVLPRAADWEGHGVTGETQGLRARVTARGMNDDLFPSEIDQTVSTMTLTLWRLSLPSSGATHSVRDLAHDRLQVVVEGDVNNAETAHEEIEKQFKEVAVTAANVFLDHCRVVAGVPFIRGVEERYRIQDGHRRIVNPYTITWYDGASGEPYRIYDGKVNATGSSGAIDSPERGSASMTAIVRSLQSSRDPDLAASLLLDASEHVITLRLREAILSLSTACEVASNGYLEDKAVQNGPDMTAMLNNRQSFAEKRFHLIPLLMDGKSLRDADPVNFELLEQLYRARNSVVHKALAEFKQESAVVRVDLPLATRFLEAARASVVWLRAL